MQQAQGVMSAQQGMTQDYNQQKMGLAQLNSQNFNAQQALQQKQDAERDQRKTETVKAGVGAIGSVLQF